MCLSKKSSNSFLSKIFGLLRENLSWMLLFLANEAAANEAAFVALGSKDSISGQGLTSLKNTGYTKLPGLLNAKMKTLKTSGS